jgi:multimeric flavodoxin WrbA
MGEKEKARRVLAINGGPRKNWNTARLLEEALKGAAAGGAGTELVHLRDLDFRGCQSCFWCKKNENWRAGRCALRDGLSPVLDLAREASGVIMGSPIYLGDVTGALRCFFERYVFINLAYDPENPSVKGKGPSIGVVYTMNVPKDALGPMGYEALFASHAGFFSRLAPKRFEQLTCCDTYQFDDYSKYHAPMFSETHKREVRERQFPLDLKAAFEMGKRFAEE